MANARPNSSGPDSSAGSSAGLPPLSGINKMDVLPEEWTLPHEWKIEKREAFSNWKMDVQSQISNISVSLNNSLKTYPHPEVGDGLTSVTNAEFESWDEERRRMAVERASSGTKMQLGLNRSATSTY